MKERIGLIDIGSNSIRLVVFQVEDNLAMREIQNIKIPARIFQYINDNHEMSQEGIDTIARIIGAFAKEAAILKADRILPKATAAIRQSTNKDDIINQVKKKTGVTIELVPEEMEAYYGFSAVVHSMSDSDGVSIDIGGGSTEITVFKDKELVEAFSFPFGA
ncbi:MAG TPA: Ppx/GppA family phosphatase, partial [Aerococcus urinaeequi]|nr:Ppx/GppA family phosphatase [Aerococcus urinaeequi]